MNNLIVSRKSLNNYAQLNILNELYQISNSPNKIYKLTYKKKKAIFYIIFNIHFFNGTIIFIFHF